MMRPDEEIEVYLYRGIVDMRRNFKLRFREHAE